MIPFPFNENRFSFFVADHLLVCQLCTNSKSDRNLLSCLKVTQCSTSEIVDAPLYNSYSLPIQVMTTGPLPAPSKWKSGRLNTWGHSSTHRTTLWRWWSGSPRLRTLLGRRGPRSSSKRSRQSLMKLPSGVVIPWCNQVAGGRPWMWQQDSAPAHKSKDTQVLLQECYEFVPFYHCPPPLPTWTRWTTSFGHMSRTSPTWPPTTPKSAWSPPSTEYSPSSRRRLWKSHAPSSRSVSRWWLKLKAATLNRCQLDYIIKLPELIFSIKVLK